MRLGRWRDQVLAISGDQAQVVTNLTSITDYLRAAEQPLELGPRQPLPALTELQAPIQDPRQIFAVGFNYRTHLADFATSAPQSPNIFTKFVSSLTGPAPTVSLPTRTIDWETELVVVVGTGGRNIAPSNAADHIGGVMVGEDLSDRELQLRNTNPQFSLAKSYPNFSATGPWLTTPDQVGDLAACTLTTTVNGLIKQSSPLSYLIFDGPALISYLSTIVTLYPGDLIFTGTPGGVGYGRTPREFLQAGDQLTGAIQGLGELQLQFTTS